jgi:DNA invertase Pin-like site-specific DNA recombinase
MAEFIAYYRVSTDKQGAAGLGMDAQREAVERFIGQRGEIVAEYVEVESGRKANRPKLKAALDECQSRRATLVIAKLDRLARNVHFISGLMESKVDFLAVDMPEANRLTIHVLAAVAEHEREMISQRTKAALAQAKARGTTLGNPRAAEAAALGRAARTIEKPPPKVLQLMEAKRAEGASLREIARELNQLGIKTPRGSQWYACTVRDQIIKTQNLIKSEKQGSIF